MLQLICNSFENVVLFVCCTQDENSAHNTILTVSQGKSLQMQDNKVVSKNKYINKWSTFILFSIVHVWHLAAHDFDRKASYEGVRVLYLAEKCIRKRRPLLIFSFHPWTSPKPAPFSLFKSVSKACVSLQQCLWLQPSLNRVHREIKRRLLLGRKVMTNLDSILKKQRHYFVNKGSV